MINLSELNPQQQKIATTTEGPLLVLAGAGSGKTRSVIYRTAYLIEEKKVNPYNILVVTFTNKAARELIDRLENTFNISSRFLWIGTFHSICTRILRYEQEYLPFSANFSIYDDDDQKSVFKKIYKNLDINPQKFPLGRVRNIISRQKNSLITPELFFEFNDRNYFSEVVEEIYREYQTYLKKNNALDFDDLLMYTAFLLHDNPEVRKKYEQKFRYIMIDEYQDTNYAQFKIINLIAEKHQNLCVVGDDDQAIYSWRGANIRNILNFRRDYKNVTIIKLEQNYRSPQTILDVANSLIKSNKERHPKKLWTNIKSDKKPKLTIVENEHKEADFVVEELIKLQRQNVSLNDCVVLYRTNAQSRVFESAFLQNDIQYQIVGGVNFYQRKEIKDIIAYLRVIGNPNDNESLLRIINFPARGIGKTTINHLLNFSTEQDITLFEAIKDSGKISEIKPIARKKLENLYLKFLKWTALSASLPVSELIKTIIKELELISIYENSDDPKDIARVENINEFITSAEEFSENYEENFGEKPLLTDYLQSISLQTDLDNLDENEEAVKLMTMHNAKGLEFDYVFIVGLEDGLLPHSRSIDNERALEEERRLFYVAITRTGKMLNLSYARYRRTFESNNRTVPSRFLFEIDESLLDKEDSSFYYQSLAPRKQKKMRNDIILESQKYFKVGQKIAHDKFGKGVILNVEGSGKNAKLTISFAGGKLKKIIGNFVKII
ncbi:MAG: hypothetical protein DRZ79_00335 [Candidatus Cloacimonadota bacterium]|nr:MAG: hypothetical protein DRZ79_00335 [Candidatus Cloacimonadota bacterium]